MNKKLQVIGQLFLDPHPRGVVDCDTCAFARAEYSSISTLCYNLVGRGKWQPTGDGGMSCKNWEYSGLRYIKNLEKESQKWYNKLRNK